MIHKDSLLWELPPAPQDTCCGSWEPQECTECRGPSAWGTGEDVNQTKAIRTCPLRGIWTQGQLVSSVAGPLTGRWTGVLCQADMDREAQKQMEE